MRNYETRLKKADFANIFKRGETANSQLVFLKFKKNDKEINRFGIVTSLKISKKAVVRNKIKRRLREIIRECLKNFKPGFDIIIIAKPAIIKENYKNIKEKLEELFRKSNFYK